MSYVHVSVLVVTCVGVWFGKAACMYIYMYNQECIHSWYNVRMYT